MKITLITGQPGSGKPTLVRRLAAGLRESDPVGFITVEVRRDGRRMGFRLTSLAGIGRPLPAP